MVEIAGCLTLELTPIDNGISIETENKNGIIVDAENIDNGLIVVLTKQPDSLDIDVEPLNSGIIIEAGLICTTSLSGNTEVLWVIDQPLLTIDGGYLLVNRN